MRFKKMVYRATRGKALTYFQDLNDQELKDYTGSKDLMLRAVFVVIFQEGLHIRNKLLRIVESFSGKNFDIPLGGDVNAIKNSMMELSKRIMDSGSLIDTTRKRLREYLKDI